MNKLIGFIIVAIVIVIGGMYFFGEDSDNTEENGPKGSVVVSVTDAAANMENVSEVRLQVSDVQMHNEAGGWTRVSTDNKTYSLLALNESGEAKLYAQSDVTAGTYDRVRVQLESVTIVTADGEEQVAAMISENFEIEGTTNVEEDATAVVELDFIAHDSLHTSAEGEYVFAPVVKMETRSNAEVETNEDTEVVTTTGGTVTTNTTVGVDVNGEAKTNFKLDSQAGLEILEDGTIQVVGGTNTESDTGVSAEGETVIDTKESVEETLEGAAESRADMEAELESESEGTVSY